MVNKVKIGEIPNKADSLYIKLYCERKGIKSRKIEKKAIKSWKSLSPSDRKRFYDTVYKRNLLHLANSLRSTKTYLKEKPKKNSSRQPITRQEIGSEIGAEPQNNSLLRETDSHSTRQNNLGEHFPNQDNHNSNHNTSIDDSLQEPSLSQEIPTNVSDHTGALDTVDRDNNPEIVQECTNIATPLLHEPTPPNVKNGQALYNMIKSHDDPDWKQLDKMEKRYYNTAVHNIKLEYIRDYKIYLESLSKNDLYKHYMKKLH